MTSWDSFWADIGADIRPKNPIEFPPRTDRIGLDLEDFIRNVKGVFESSAELQSVSAQQEAENDTELWRRFSSSADGALTVMDAVAGLDLDLCDRQV